MRLHAAALMTVALAIATPVLVAPRHAEAAPDDASRERALALFEEGKQAYRDGRFDDSVALLTEAMTLVDEPVLLYNLARAQEGRGRFAEAIVAYRDYLARAKDISDRGAIEQKVTSLERALAERAELERERDEARNKPAPVAPPPTKASDTPSPAPWIVVAVGAGGFIAGGVLAGLAVSQHDDADAAPSQVETVELAASADDKALASTVLFAVSGAVLGAGAVWGIVDLATLDASEAPATVSLRLGAGWVAVRAEL